MPVVATKMSIGSAMTASVAARSSASSTWLGSLESTGAQSTLRRGAREARSAPRPCGRRSPRSDSRRAGVGRRSCHRHAAGHRCATEPRLDQRPRSDGTLRARRRGTAGPQVEGVLVHAGSRRTGRPRGCRRCRAPAPTPWRTGSMVAERVDSPSWVRKIATAWPCDQRRRRPARSPGRPRDTRLLPGAVAGRVIGRASDVRAPSSTGAPTGMVVAEQHRLVRNRRAGSGRAPR